MKSTFTKLAFALLFFALQTFHYSTVNAQGGCIEIESILVDACGSPEGENEMARFIVGSSALSTSNLVVDWPNNTWQGLCQDASTAATVNAINQTIVGCGFLSEPVGGVLPANSKVLLLTSTNINLSANSFSNVNDTMIVLFQCAGNTSGHFANYNTSPGLRTLIIEFTGSCSDSATYDRTLLVNQYGAIGGFSFENDGAYVLFDAAGNPTYLNNGCQALGTVLNVSAGPDVGLCPGGSTVAALQGVVNGATSGVSWSGGTGVFSNPTSLSTTYTPGSGETGIVYITLTASGDCNSTKTDTMRVNIVTSMPTPVINVNGNQLTSSITDSSYFYNWYLNGNLIPFQFGTSYTATAVGCYQLVLSTVGGCTTTSDTVCLSSVGLNELQDLSGMTIHSNAGSQPWISVQSKINGAFTLLMTDITGRIVRQKQITIHSGMNIIYPEWNGIAAGLYNASIQSRDGRITEMILLGQ